MNRSWFSLRCYGRRFWGKVLLGILLLGIGGGMGHVVDQWIYTAQAGYCEEDTCSPYGGNLSSYRPALQL